MLTVAAVGQYIIAHWQGPALDGPSITAALLLHDVGNLVKFDLSESARVIEPALFTDEWRERQRSMREKYGAYSHQATLSMLRELEVPEKIQQLVRGMDASNVCAIASDSWEQQICQYADLRVTPRGVVSLEERLQDLHERYASKYPNWSDTLFAENGECAKKIEQALQNHTSADITSVPAEKIQAYLVELSHFAVDTSDANGV